MANNELLRILKDLNRANARYLGNLDSNALLKTLITIEPELRKYASGFSRISPEFGKARDLYMSMRRQVDTCDIHFNGLNPI